MLKRLFSTKGMLILIVVFSAYLRLHGIEWDQGYHLHPDERAIIMTVADLDYPSSIAEFASKTSPWNTNFFAYGSFPFYLLKIVGDMMSGLNPLFAEYSLLIIPGRMLSAFFDLLTLVFIYKIARLLFTEKVGLVAAFFYGVSVLPIQLSHFYAVDTLLTAFITITLYLLLLFYKKPTPTKALLIGISFGFAVATKISALVLLAPLGIALIIDVVLQISTKDKPRKHIKQSFINHAQHIFYYGSVIILTSGLAFVLLSPYVIFDFQNFWLQTQQQSMMTRDPFTFPYTLQYVGKLPYLYELKNVFFYGLGPFIALISGLGFVALLYKLLRKPMHNQTQILILLTFFICYFAIVGRFTIGFMRYMLPLYPLFAVFSAYGIWQLIKYFAIVGTARNIVIGYLIIASLTWPMSFIEIYSKDNTRVEATEWIHTNIPAGSTIAIEHWDDRLPLFMQDPYITETYELYNPDTPEKWMILNQQIQRTDYIIIASNRLYTPLQKLTACEKLPPDRCYDRTAEYYESLFSGNLGFTKVAEFSNYPRVPLLNTAINDQSADESFTVYDHPKIMIFKKESK